ncbi:hypothetical protein AB0H36_24290 [Kribbella sp. NPDC050820]|uniref:hypothetical protein n=1 Tax=Kribbella sp. NPDC050820 TaxID=3155408 RepID=UPI00340FF734
MPSHRSGRIRIPGPARRGRLHLILLDGTEPIVVFDDGRHDPLAAPLEWVRYLGAAPPALGIKWLTEGAIRVAIGNEKRIIWFTGDLGALDKANQEVTLGRLSGDVDPVELVKSVLALGRVPSIWREQRQAKSAWTELLSHPLTTPVS